MKTKRMMRSVICMLLALCLAAAKETQAQIKAYVKEFIADIH